MRSKSRKSQRKSKKVTKQMRGGGGNNSVITKNAQLLPYITTALLKRLNAKNAKQAAQAKAQAAQAEQPTQYTPIKHNTSEQRLVLKQQFGSELNNQFTKTMKTSFIDTKAKIHGISSPNIKTGKYDTPTPGQPVIKPNFFTRMKQKVRRKITRFKQT